MNARFGLFYLLVFLFPACTFAGDVTLTLSEYQAQALRANHELREAGFAAQGADEAARGAFTGYFPKVSAAAGIANTNILPGLNSPIGLLPLTKDSNAASIGMITAVQPLYAGGRIANGNRLAKTGFAAARQQLRAKRNEVLAESEKKYRQLQVLNSKMLTLLAYEKLMDSLYAQVTEALERGLATKTDALRVKLKKEEIAVRKNQLGKLTETAGKDLILYAGMAVSGAVRLGEQAETVAPADYSTQSLRGQLETRPEYQLLQIGVDAAALQKKIKIGGYLPSFAVGASVYRTDYYANANFSRDANYQDTVAFGMLSIPLSDWWEASHKIKEMRLKEDTAREQLKALGDYLLLDMENKLRTLETAYDQVNLAQIEIEQAQANKSEIEDGYKNGTEKLSDYLQALALELDSQNKLVETKAEYFKAKTAFLLATGQ
ncbi:MAG: TolC family protein [Elusimicrobiaceae bacterium]